MHTGLRGAGEMGSLLGSLLGRGLFPAGWRGAEPEQRDYTTLWMNSTPWTAHLKTGRKPQKRLTSEGSLARRSVRCRIPFLPSSRTGERKSVAKTTHGAAWGHSMDLLGAAEGVSKGADGRWVTLRRADLRSVHLLHAGFTCKDKENHGR